MTCTAITKTRNSHVDDAHYVTTTATSRRRNNAAKVCHVSGRSNVSFRKQHEHHELNIKSNIYLPTQYLTTRKRQQAKWSKTMRQSFSMASMVFIAAI